MFSSFGLSGTFFVMPVCYHPTTVMMVDDDPTFLKYAALQLKDKCAILPFNSVDEAIQFIQQDYHHRPFTTRCIESNRLNVLAIRNEVYNPDRFKEIVTTVVDYDMPNKNGIELINTMALPPDVLFNAFIMLTGSISSPNDPRIAGQGIRDHQLFKKDDPECLNKLLTEIKQTNATIFQWFSYEPAQYLAQDPHEHALFLFNKDCIELIDAYVKQHEICELYLFDRQGSYLFLDEHAHFSWFFIRDETGIENTIQLATQYNAPRSIIEALKSKEVILSLYEPDDIKHMKTIDWERCLLKATKKTTSIEYLERFGVTTAPTYYYAFTKECYHHGIDQGKILSFRDFLKSQ